MSVIRNTALALGLTTVVAAGAGAYVYRNGWPWGDRPSSAYAQVIPDDATLALHVSTDPQRWGQLQPFGSPQIKRQLTAQAQTWEQQLLTHSGISLEKDVLPWVDGVTLAMLAATEVQSASGPEFLAVVGIKNPAKALGLMQKLGQNSEVKIKTLDHQGVKISELLPQGKTPSGSPANPLYAAMVKRQLVIAPTRRPIEMAIEASQGDPSFADLPGVSAALQDTLQLKTPLAHLYVPDYSQFVGQLMTASPDAAPLSPQMRKQLEQVGAIHLGLGVEGEGLHLKTVAAVDPSLRPANYQPSSNQAQARFPVNTIAFFNGSGLSQSWDKMATQSSTLPESALVLNLLRNSATQANLDLDREVVSWMTGEFAVGIVPVDQGVVGQVGIGTALVLDSGDRPTTEATLTKLDRLAAKNTLKLSQRQVGSTQITEWLAPTPQPEALVGHGWLDADSVFIALGQPLVETLAKPPQQSLLANPVYQTVMAKLPSKGMGYGFVNFEQAIATAQRSPFASLVANGQTIEVLSSIQGLGLASSWEQADRSTLEVYLALKTTQDLEAQAQRQTQLTPN